MTFVGYVCYFSATWDSSPHVLMTCLVFLLMIFPLIFKVPFPLPRLVISCTDEFNFVLLTSGRGSLCSPEHARGEEAKLLSLLSCWFSTCAGFRSRMKRHEKWNLQNIPKNNIWWELFPVNEPLLLVDRSLPCHNGTLLHATPLHASGRGRRLDH